MTTAFQASNLNKLADYLDSLPADYKHFSMQLYFGAELVEDDDGDYPDEYEDNVSPSRAAQPLTSFACGAAACAIGHGVNAGIKPTPDDHEDWGKYSERVFGERVSTPAGQYMFGVHNEDCHFAAAARIRNFLADPSKYN